MPNYTVEVYVNETEDNEVFKVVWVANYKDASQALETAGRRAMGIANYMRKTGAEIHNLGAMTFDRKVLHKGKQVKDHSADLKKLTEFE